MRDFDPEHKGSLCICDWLLPNITVIANICVEFVDKIFIFAVMCFKTREINPSFALVILYSVKVYKGWHVSRALLH